MARRVVIRSRALNTAVAQIEEMIKADYHTLWANHIEELENMCESIVEDAISLVPVDSGKLRDSIQARVSRSNRYPGLMVSASAKDNGFDYALIQEENEHFSHEVGQAHYLADAFYGVVNDWYYTYTDKDLPEPVVEYHPYGGGDNE